MSNQFIAPEPENSSKSTQLKNVTINFEAGTITAESEQGNQTYKLESSEAFYIMSKAWLRAGWDAKYVYSFTWLGRPIIQLPDDAFRIQEMIYQIKPDVIVETGIAHGGSLIFYASLCKAMGKGRVIGVEIELRPPNRKAIEDHELAPLIKVISGDSIDPTTAETVRGCIDNDETVLVILDSCHTKTHVLSELNLYANVVTIGSFIIVMDGIMQQVAGAPRTQPDWTWNNPRQAVVDFLDKHHNFELVEPHFPFNEGLVKNWVTYAPNGILRRIS